MQDKVEPGVMFALPAASVWILDQPNIKKIKKSRLLTSRARSDLKDELCVSHTHTHSRFGLWLETQTPRPIMSRVFLPPRLNPNLASRLLCLYNSQGKNRAAAYTSIPSRFLLLRSHESKTSELLSFQVEDRPRDVGPLMVFNLIINISYKTSDY